MDKRILADLDLLKKAIDQDNISDILYQDSSESQAIAALQRILNNLGYGEYLNWQKYGADGQYGTGTQKAVKAFMQDIIGDGSVITKIMGQAIIDQAENIKKEPVLSVESGAGLSVKQIKESGKDIIYVTSGQETARFINFRKGLYTRGTQKSADFINSQRNQLISGGATNSEINMILAVSENEGSLDAINTWDNSFLSFGMFQWTMGPKDFDGELPVLLHKIKKADSNIFEKYFGRYGIGIAKAGKISGYLSLGGNKISSPVDKNRFRSHEWAFRFWLAGQDLLVQMVEILHALSRIDMFYNSDNYKIKGYYISDLITSEYGTALILDNHVNRPAYIKPCLEQALGSAGLPDDPVLWNTEHELRLIENYLNIRRTYGFSPMTDSDHRAAVIKKYSDNNIISFQRGSFNQSKS